MSATKPDKILPIGERFGMLTVQGEYLYKPVGKKQKYVWYEKFRCDCGNITRQRRTDVEHGRVKSCGCYIANNRSKLCGNRNHKTTKKTHGDSRKRLYKIFQNIKTRCNNPKSDNYNRYGGRGIKNLWDSYEDFKRDMGPSYYEHTMEFGEENTSLDRIDNNGNYCKDNCRWATRQEQAFNTRTNRVEIRAGKKMSISEIYKIAEPKVNYSTFTRRYYISKRPLKDCLYREAGTRSKDVLDNK